MKINNFTSAEQFLALHIPKTSKTTFPGELGLKRAKYFLKLLGNPQEKLKIIHVAGTSGKGSTCYLISLVLAFQGFKVGLHQSPHLINVTERFQIKTSASLSSSNQNISREDFVDYLNKIIPVINLVGKTFHGPLTYFEILVGMAFYIFNDKHVDYAVIETGLGGKYDGTNVVSRSDKLSVLTKIGLDHTNILGKTIEEITFQKAMIINEKSQAISINQDQKAEKVIREVVKNKLAKIDFVNVGNAFMRSVRRCRVSRPKVLYNLNLFGDYQKENAALALATVDFLGKRDGFIINQEKISKAFSKAKFPGRFDIKKINGKTVIFDGAHNPQKMEAFIDSLTKKYPKQKFNFLLAFKKGKNYKKMLKIIILKAVVHKIVIASFFTKNQDMVNESINPNEIISYCRDAQIGHPYDVKIIPDLKKAWEEVLNQKELIVITGSLYLVGEVFKLIKNN